MYDLRRAIQLVLPGGELLTLLGSDACFEPFYPETSRGLLPVAEADIVALSCLDGEGREVGRIKMNSILGYLIE